MWRYEVAEIKRQLVTFILTNTLQWGGGMEWKINIRLTFPKAQRVDLHSAPLLDKVTDKMQVRHGDARRDADREGSRKFRRGAPRRCKSSI